MASDMVAKITLLPNFNQQTDWNNFNFELCYSKLRNILTDLNSGCFSTAKLIVSLYAKYSNGSDSPKLFTTIRSIAAERKVTERTIHNHLKILTSISLLKGYDRTSRGIVLLFNDEFIQFSVPSDRKKFPILKKKQELININSTVDKCITSTFNKNTANELSGGTFGQVNGQFIPPGTIDLGFLVENLWNAARYSLYPRKEFSLSENETIKEIIKLNYYSDLNDTTNRNTLLEYHNILLSRIQLAKKFINRDPVKRFVPEPSQYFSKSSIQSGFQNTGIWFIKSLIIRKISKELDAKLKQNGINQIRKSSYNQAKEFFAKQSNSSMIEKYRLYLGVLNPIFENELRHC